MRDLLILPGTPFNRPFRTELYEGPKARFDEVLNNCLGHPAYRHLVDTTWANLRSLDECVVQMTTAMTGDPVMRL